MRLGLRQQGTGECGTRSVAGPDDAHPSDRRTGRQLDAGETWPATLLIDEEDPVCVKHLATTRGHGTNPNGAVRGQRDDPGSIDTFLTQSQNLANNLAQITSDTSSQNTLIMQMSDAAQQKLASERQALQHDLRIACLRWSLGAGLLAFALTRDEPLPATPAPRRRRRR